MSNFELIVSIVNRGFTSTVMDAARSVGAKGGTIINAKGSGAHESEKMFGLTVTPEKEMVYIIAPKDQRNDIMKAIIEKAGLNSLGMGICFSMPIDDVMGVALGINNPETEETKEEEKKEKKPTKKTTKKEETKEEVKEEKPAKKASKKEEKVDLSSLTLTELKAMAKEREIKGYSKLKKEELIEVLK